MLSWVGVRKKKGIVYETWWSLELALWKEKAKLSLATFIARRRIVANALSDPTCSQGLKNYARSPYK